MSILHLQGEVKPAKLKAFIEDKSPYINPQYTVLFLYLNVLASRDESIELAILSKRFNILITDIIMCIEYFKDLGLITESSPETGTDRFLDFSGNTVSKTTGHGTYSPKELSIILENSSDLADLYKYAEVTFSRQLTYDEQNKILTFHEYYNLPFPVIVAVLDYANLENKLNFNYLEKLCQALNYENIKTVEDASKYLRTSDDNYTRIFKALGLSGRVTPAQKKLIDSWFDTFNFTIDIVLEACDIACVESKKANLNYTNGILKNWHAQGFTNLADIKNYVINSSNPQNQVQTPQRAKKTTTKTEMLKTTDNTDEIFKLINKYNQVTF